MRVFDYQLLTAGDMSGSLISKGQSIIQMQIASFQAIWTGAPVGTLNLQITNEDITFIPPAQVIWTTYTGSLTSVNGAGDFVWNLTSLGFNAVRVIYTFTSGSGLLNINVSGKGPS